MYKNHFRGAMKSFLYNFFHHETSNGSQDDLSRVPKDESLWPASWKTIQYKTYKLFKPISLTKVSGVLFDNFLTKRSSSIGREGKGQMSKELLSYILRCGYGLKDDTSLYRTVPSAGKRYPLELYVLVFRDIEGLDSGTYHYNIKNHSLETVSKVTLSLTEKEKFYSYEWLESKNLMICLTGVFDRMTDKYGDRGYRHILLEAGHVGQNILLAGVEMNTQGVPIGGIREGSVESFLGLESDKEKVVYSIFF